jgi:hypothetical protein
MATLLEKLRTYTTVVSDKRHMPGMSRACSRRPGSFDKPAVDR